MPCGSSARAVTRSLPPALVAGLVSAPTPFDKEEGADENAGEGADENAGEGATNAVPVVAGIGANAAGDETVDPGLKVFRP